MSVVPEISATEVLTAFRGDAPYLFFGATFVAVGLVSAIFTIVRRKYDSLLIYFACFAVLYGLRLLIQSALLGITGYSWPFFLRLRSAIDFVVPIPAVMFLRAAGLLARADLIVAYAAVAVIATLGATTLALGPSPTYHLINNIAVIVALTSLAVR